jgi:GPI mannosyltransferase 3
MPKSTISSAPSSPRANNHQHSLNSKGSLVRQIPSALPTAPNGRDVLLFLVASRLLNALVIQTFFQPDEYFQALEPAWELAFGRQAGAWITWVRRHLV